MKKNINIYIVGILALLLLGVNVITLKKYRALKTYCQEQITDKSITGQKEMALWVNSQIAFSVNGMKMPNILLTSNPQLSSSASFLRLNVLSSLN